jgi:transcriptional regulator with XRE-family HTH domain
VDLIAIGSKIVELRAMHGVSAESLAETVGISRGYLSRLENGRQVPSLVILDAIAQKFSIELGWFFGTSSTGQVAVHSAVNEAENEFPPKATFTYEALCTRRSHKRALPFLAFFRPGTRTRVAVHDAEYFRYVVAGCLVLHYDGERYELSAGDAIYYDATSPHELECVGASPAKVITLFVKPSLFPVMNGQPMTIEGHL